ncbi:hypothetical protein [Kaarinaea lacus]
MNRKFNLALASYIMCCLLTIQCSIAAPLGLPKNTAKIGYGIGAGYVSVDDPDGDTKNNLTVLPFNFIYTDWLKGEIRQWTELYYYKTSLDADANNIGQDVERYGIRFSLQKSFRLARSWSPWLGVGIDVSNASYTARHTKDSDGFLIQSFPDREETDLSVLLNMISEWSLRQEWTIGAKLEQSIPTSGDIMEFSAVMTILYRY